MEVEATPSIGQQNNPHPVSPSSPKKRPFDEIDRPDVNHGIEQTAASDPTPVPQNPSPAVPPITATATTTNKKVKLTPAEKQAKERQKAEEKARKDEERRIKEEEKKKRDEEKEEKRRLKEEEKQAKEEEKKKKDRAQMRLNAFFVKPASRPSQPQTAATNPSKPGAAEPGGLSKSEPAEKKPSSDYEQGFPPFFVQSHVKLAPSHHFTRDPAGLDHARQKIDTALGSEDVVKPLTFNPTELFNIRPYKRRQGRTDIPTVRDIVTSMQHSPANTIDLTGNTEPTKHATRVEDMLKKIPVKMLKFGENVRPPYRGTFTKKIPGDQAVKLCRNPFARVVREFNYDYDSEAEWEEPEEGEDLDTSGDEDPSEDDADDLDDFLDDADDELKRRNIVGSLEPICSGIRWVDGRDVDPELKAFRMELLCDTARFPIDPFSDMYWKPAATTGHSVKPLNNTPGHHFVDIRQQQFLQPKFPPSNLSKVSSLVSGGARLSTQTSQPLKSRVPFPPNQVEEFKAVVSGSDLTKAGLIEVLKKRFPKVSKDVIKDTLTSTAVRHGRKEAEKRWVLL